MAMTCCRLHCFFTRPNGVRSTVQARRLADSGHARGDGLVAERLTAL